jgi:malate synthase
MAQATSVKVLGETDQAAQEILTDQAKQFLALLSEKFEPTRKSLLADRVALQETIENGQDLDFCPETADVRNGDWKVASVPDDLQDRRVEITGPVDRKMVINALNSGANVFMADFEDSNSPTWLNNIQGQVNMRDAVNGTIEFTNEKGKHYKLNPDPATLMVRPRGWHLVEKGFTVNGQPISGSLFDFGLFFFHNAKNLLKKGTRPYFYLAKLEHYKEARLWNDIFEFAQEHVGVPKGTIRATVLIETITAGFQMDEILYELRDHSVGLNCGRWDYIFSYIKRHRSRPDYVVPNRAQVGMTCHFLNSYVQKLIQICHRRGTFAMGGMAAQIPIKNDPDANEKAMEKVRQDKLREVKAGHDGTWVAHPGLIGLARDIFDQYMSGPNQIDNKGNEVQISAADLLKVPQGTITADGLRINIDVGLRYLEAWLRGNGCVPIYNLMEDAATAEISRTQVWQWVHHGAKLESGETVTSELVNQTTQDVLDTISKELGDAYENSRFDLAGTLFLEMMTGDSFPEFLTLVAYDHI